MTYIDEHGAPADEITYELVQELSEHYHTKKELLDLLQGTIDRIKAIPEEEDE